MLNICICSLTSHTQNISAHQHQSVRVEWRKVGGEAQEGGMYVYLQLIHITVQQKPTEDYKATIIQFKKNE